MELTYHPLSMRSIIGDGYVRTCGGIDEATVDVVVTKNHVAVELDDWMCIHG